MRASFFKFLYLLLFTCVLTHNASFATADEFDDIPDEYIEEADDYFKTCNDGRVTSQYVNCACMSTALLRERVELGPTVPRNAIVMNITDECFDAINAAGPTYERCLRNAATFKPGTDPEKFCECVANTYVRTMNMQKPSIRSTSIVKFEVYSFSKCRDPRSQTPLPIVN